MAKCSICGKPVLASQARENRKRVDAKGYVVKVTVRHGDCSPRIFGVKMEDLRDG